MWAVRTIAPDVSDVQRAGMAWACPFSSSDEFEAAIIRARRDAGVYGPKRTRRRLGTAALIAAAALGAALLILAAA
jgi:hypothetical protein